MYIVLNIFWLLLWHTSGESIPPPIPALSQSIPPLIPPQLMSNNSNAMMILNSTNTSEQQSKPKTLSITSTVTDSGFSINSKGQLKLYPYTSADKSLAIKIMANQTINKSLPPLPKLTKSHILALTPPKPSRTPGGSPIVGSMQMYVSSTLQEELNLVGITNTEMDCYIAPPSESFTNMDNVSFDDAKLE